MTDDTNYTDEPEVEEKRKSSVRTNSEGAVGREFVGREGET
ncbi:MAG: hypothetical protein V8S95_03350 [Odoribacter sp.]